MSKTIRNDVLNWLLEDENPEVKYRTMIELLNMSKDKSEGISYKGIQAYRI